MNKNRKIQLLIPDLPLTKDLLPWLTRIDSSQVYANFGPLVNALEWCLASDWPTDFQDKKSDLPPIQIATLGSGTASLELGIAAMQLDRGGEVLLPAFTFPATAAAVIRNSLRPVFADVTADSWQLSPATARAAAAQRRLALVIPVATFGCPLDASAWDSFFEETGIPVLMDAAAAFGNQPIGRHAHVAMSMHATKPFGIGEGGLFISRSAAMVARVKQFSNFGFGDGIVEFASGNAKLSEYAAAVALAQWSRWDEIQSRRRAMWAAYRKSLEAVSGIVLQAGFATGALPANLVIHLSDTADHVSKALARSDIPTRRWYFPPLHHHPAFAACEVFNSEGATGMPVTHDMCKYALGIPWHSFLTIDEQSIIVDALANK